MIIRQITFLSDIMMIIRQITFLSDIMEGGAISFLT